MMFESTSTRKELILVLLAVMGLLLAACGGGGDSSAISGQDAPDFTLPSATGEQVSLADYAGQPVLLYFHMAVQ